MRNRINKIFNAIWPIHRSEIKKFLASAFMMFCILFVQNIIRATKDSVVNTLIGVEVVSFLKLYGVVPASILFTIAYIKLIAKVKSTNLFYIFLSSFLIFFLVFGFILFPNVEMFHINKETTSSLILNFPHFKWFILLAANWSFSLFYIIAELWPTTIFGLLCWQFINSITTVEQSKRFYILFGLITQTGMYISGQMLLNSSHITEKIIEILNLDTNKTLVFIQFIMSIATIFGALALLSFWYINKYIIDKSIKNIEFKAQKKHISLKSSFAYIFSSRYIGLIALILLCYGMTINLIEGPWKTIATQKYPSPEEYTAFVGKYLSDSGILTIILALIGSNIINFFGWRAGALFTPVAMFVTGMMFFLSNKFTSNEFLHNIVGVADPVMLIIYFGMIQNIVTKSAKYTLFDSTKEMAYVPLEHEIKTKGKAAADMIGGKFGKSLSSFLQHIVFIAFPACNYVDIIDYIMVLFIIMCVIWIYAINALNKKYLSLMKR